MNSQNANNSHSGGETPKKSLIPKILRWIVYSVCILTAVIAVCRLYDRDEHFRGIILHFFYSQLIIWYYTKYLLCVPYIIPVITVVLLYIYKKKLVWLSILPPIVILFIGQWQLIREKVLPLSHVIIHFAGWTGVVILIMFMIDKFKINIKRKKID